MTQEKEMNTDREIMDDNLQHDSDILIITRVVKDYEGMGDELANEGIL